ncbi:hypothetical protein DV515_00009088 [Chloebia gouldiae]|uniref:Uncharacterized protein n=1 Tax=Chloebia gouldiae TaxID=44316 RepID=A0A3L8SDX0_CHLGU|nr:hypothetical protein DV515_00009088 [Chloebia gouldiae]
MEFPRCTNLPGYFGSSFSSLFLHLHQELRHGQASSKYHPHQTSKSSMSKQEYWGWKRHGKVILAGPQLCCTYTRQYHTTSDFMVQDLK